MKNVKKNTHGIGLVTVEMADLNGHISNLKHISMAGAKFFNFASAQRMSGGKYEGEQKIKP